MATDVYADDDALRDAAALSSSLGIAEFSIVADADPDVLLRLAAIFNLLNVAPRAFHLDGVNETVNVRALVERCTQRQADHAARKLRQLTCVHSVELQHAER
jgi:hypothetical protein